LGRRSKATDLLALDKQGRLVVIELKRTDSGGRMELQARPGQPGRAVPCRDRTPVALAACGSRRHSSHPAARCGAPPHKGGLPGPSCPKIGGVESCSSLAAFSSGLRGSSESNSGAGRLFAGQS
jgi:hypothetical protein